MQTIQLGAITLRLLLDARGQIEGERVFYPATPEQWSPGLVVDAEGNVPIQVTSLLISENGRHTLVDTGFGEEERPEREDNLLKSLTAAGLQPKDIGRVILTHAHGDHCMGNTLLRAGRWLPTFPLAEYVIQEDEIAAMRDAGDPVWATRFHPLVQRDKLRLIAGRTELSESIVCWPTPGYSIGHQSVMVRGDEGAALFVGDLAVLAGNLEHPAWGPSWAWSREADQENRRAVAEWAVEEGAIVIVGHDPERTWVRLQRAEQGYRATVVDQA